MLPAGHDLLALVDSEFSRWSARTSKSPETTWASSIAETAWPSEDEFASTPRTAVDEFAEAVFPAYQAAPPRSPTDERSALGSERYHVFGAALNKFTASFRQLNTGLARSESLAYAAAALEEAGLADLTKSVRIFMIARNHAYPKPRLGYQHVGSDITDMCRILRDRQSGADNRVPVRLSRDPEDR
jgi:hypothetical protein